MYLSSAMQKELNEWESTRFEEKMELSEIILEVAGMYKAFPTIRCWIDSTTTTEEHLRRFTALVNFFQGDDVFERELGIFHSHVFYFD